MLLRTFAHEYALHTIPYVQFLQFVRSTDNVYLETALYYFYHSYSCRSLDAEQQHRVHGGTGQIPLSKTVESTWNNQSGNAEFNALMQGLLQRLTDLEEKKRLVTEAKTDIANQRRNPGALIKQPTPPTQITVPRIQQVRPVAGTMDALLQQLALVVYGTNGIKASASSQVRNALMAQPSPYWPLTLEAYLTYFTRIYGDLFGLDANRLGAALTTAMTSTAPASPSTLLPPPPVPRSLLEAWVTYAACGGYQEDAGSLRQLADQVRSDLTENDWTAVQNYAIYRYGFSAAFLQDEYSAPWYVFLTQVLPKMHPVPSTPLTLRTTTLLDYLENYRQKIAYIAAVEDSEQSFSDVWDKYFALVQQAEAIEQKVNSSNDPLLQTRIASMKQEGHAKADARMQELYT